MTHAKSGFTLMELMIALVILGVIAGIGIPAYMNFQKRARLDATKQTLRVIKSAIEMYEAQTGKKPQTLKDLIRRPSDPEAAEGWMEGGYLKDKKMPKDGWGKAFHYSTAPDGDNPYTLFSYGPSGRRGKKGERVSAWGR